MKLREGSLTALSGGPQGGDTPRGQRLAAGGQVCAELRHPPEGRGAGALEPPAWGLCSRLALGCRGHRPGGDILISLSLDVRILISFPGVGVLLLREAGLPSTQMITTD